MMTLRASRLRWCLPLIALASAISASAENRILVPVKINDQPVNFIFDTGASGAVLWQSAATRLGLRTTPPPPGSIAKPGAVLASLTEPVKVELLDQVLPSVQLGVIANPPQPVDNDGFIGWPSLRRTRLLFHGATLHFEVVRAVPPETSQWLKLREDTDWRVLSLELPANGTGKTAHLGIYSGNPDGVFFNPETWTRWRADHANSPSSLLAYYMPGAGLVVTEVIWADEVELQGVTLHGVPVSCMNTSEVHDYPPGTLAVVGLAALRRMDMVFDGTGAVYVQTASTPPPAYVHNRLGAVFMPDVAGNDALVAHVAAGSPAAKAGLRFGDMLLKIDQLDVTAWRTQPGILPLSRFWEQPAGTPVHLTVLRGKKKLTVDIVLRNLLGPVEK